MNKLVGAAIFAASAALTYSANAVAQTADTIYTNGLIYTVNEAQPWAEAVAIKDDRFVAVGTAADIAAHKGADTEVIDLAGKLMMPGLIDAHIHLLSWYGAEMLEGQVLRFPDGASVAEMQKLLAGYAKANPDLEVLVAENYNSGEFPNGEPTKEVLDEVIPDRPVIAMADTEHEAWLNSAALRRANITPDTKDPVNGVIVRDPETGEPAGTLREAAAGRWGWSEMPVPSVEQEVEGLRTLLPYLNSLGLTSLKVLHAERGSAQALKHLEQSGELSMRFALAWTYLSPLSPLTQEELDQIIAERSKFETPLVNTNFVKINIDGTPTGTAFVFEPYEGTDDHGEVFIGLEDLTDEVAKFDAQGIGTAFHVMGDAGMHRVLNAIEKARERNDGLKARHQLAHATMISPEDLKRIAELNVTAEFSPPGIMYDHPLDAVLKAAIGPERLEDYSPVKQLFELGGRAVIASDGPLFWIDPFEAIAKMVRRVYPDGKTLTLGQVIRTMTIDAAYILDNDDAVGSIEIGKFADLIVVDRDIFKSELDEVAKTKVFLTIVGGAIRARRKRLKKGTASILILNKKLTDKAVSRPIATRVPVLQSQPYR
jgi:predicted amidohydrolase YtcJ